MNILDLPNEMIVAIFKKLNIIDVFYSLLGINEYLDQLILDPLYIHDLNFTKKSLFDIVSPMDSQVLDRVCDQILPRINDKVTKLTIEPTSMERILCTVEYPNLSSLSLVNFQEETLLKHFTDHTYLHRLITDQITDLRIEIADGLSSEGSQRNESNIFPAILSQCKRLTDLTFSQWFTDRSLATFTSHLSSTSCLSSTLTKLNLNVNTFDDCLYLLNGCLPCLSTLIINIIKVLDTTSNLDNTNKLPQLKCFSLRSYSHTFFYDQRIVPLLHRMSNLEELTLFLSVIRFESTYIDGNHLHNEILIHMPRLNQFRFCISTTLFNVKVKITPPSHDDIQRSFIGRGTQHIGSCVTSNPTMIRRECYIYSIPYSFDTFLHLTNAYLGHRFDKVRCLIMADSQPFEHQLFKIIAQDFPFLRKLGVINLVAQNNQEHICSSNTFHHLVNLHLTSVHIDYVKQFLFERNTQLPRLISLDIGYETLAIVTNNFTNDASRRTCAQLQHLTIKEPFVRPENFHSYFPLL